MGCVLDGLCVRRVVLAACEQPVHVLHPLMKVLNVMAHTHMHKECITYAEKILSHNHKLQPFKNRCVLWHS